VHKAERTAGLQEMESACVGVTGRHISSVNNKGAVAISRNDRLVRPEDLKRVLEVARSVDVPTDQKVLHVIPRAYTVDGQNGVQESRWYAWFPPGCGNTYHYSGCNLGTEPHQMYPCIGIGLMT